MKRTLVFLGLALLALLWSAPRLRAGDPFSMMDSDGMGGGHESMMDRDSGSGADADAVSALVAQFEQLGRDARQASSSDMKQVWDSLGRDFHITGSNAGKVHDLADLGLKEARTTRDITRADDARNALALDNSAQAAKKRAEYRGKADDDRERVNSIRKDMWSKARSILKYATDDQKRDLNNWLMVSTGMLEKGLLDRPTPTPAAPAKAAR